jgi:polyisoprenoid-binding protein YceI
MKKVAIFALSFLAAVMLVHPAGAEPPQWEFDRAHGYFYFDIKHIFTTVRGHFADYDGVFQFDPDQTAASRFDIRVKTESVDTRHARRDKHLRSGDFFDVGEFPEMRFASTRIRRVADNQFIAEGKMTIKDVTRDVTIPFTFFGARQNPFNKKQIVAGFEARFTIDRLVYNVGSGKYYEMGVIGKDVDVLVALEMVRPK